MLHSGGAGERSLVLAVRELFGRDEDLRNINVAGKTDIWIAHRIFEAHGIQPDREQVDRFLDAYLRHLQPQLAAHNGRVLPGFPELLHALGRLPHVAIGLLTGNLRRGAQIKLSHYGLVDHFSFEPNAIGAFADDSHDRNRLGPFARERARKVHGIQFEPSDIFIIGDTPYDIACAKAIHAHGVGVATGRYSRQDLQDAGADFLFDDLSDVDNVIRALGIA
jgi:phosphoglycolate phosphatase-like HAD superfamily hydrolase